MYSLKVYSTSKAAKNGQIFPWQEGRNHVWAPNYLEGHPG